MGHTSPKILAGGKHQHPYFGMLIKVKDFLKNSTQRSLRVSLSSISSHVSWSLLGVAVISFPIDHPIHEANFVPDKVITLAEE